jgi:hypothetical protein
MITGRKGVREPTEWALPRPLTPNRVGALSLGGNRSCDFVEGMDSELLALYLPEEMQLLYRQRRCGRHRHTMSCFSWYLSSWNVRHLK